MEMQTDLSAATTRDDTDGTTLRTYAELTRNHDLRLSRALDYLARSLEREDPLEANVGSVNCGLIVIAQCVEEAIIAALGSGPPDLKRLLKLKPAIDTHLRLAGQIGRFANLELRIAEGRQPKKTDDRPTSRSSEAPSATDSRPSEDSAV